MKLIIDGHTVFAKTDQSLFDIVRELGMLTGKLSTDPIAAKIAGRVFTLNYVPVRTKDVVERESVRRAIAASNGTIRLLYYSDPAGRDAYRRTAQFVLFLAIRRLWPTARAKMNCTVGSGLYIKVSGAEDFSAELLKEEVWKIVAENITLHRRRIPTSEAIAYYSDFPTCATPIVYQATAKCQTFSAFTQRASAGESLWAVKPLRISTSWFLQTKFEN